MINRRAEDNFKICIQQYGNKFSGKHFSLSYCNVIEMGEGSESECEGAETSVVFSIEW